MTPTERRSAAGESTRELLAAIRLASPSLPVGAYAYSQGLETAVDLGWVHDRDSAGVWIDGLLEDVLPRLDLPILLRLRDALEGDDFAAVRAWEDRLLAARESAELQAEERDLGAALARLGADLEDVRPGRTRTWLGAFADSCRAEAIGPTAMAGAWLAAWAEHLVSAAVRLVPLGQTDGQRLIRSAHQRMPAAIEAAFATPDTAIGVATPGLAIASALHEIQYSRLFRS